MNKNFLAVIILGMAFMLTFTVFQTASGIEQVVIDSIQKENSSFKGSGYISLAVIYATFAACNWLAPSILHYLKPKLTMIVGGISYIVFILSFLWPQTWLLYTVSAFVGFGAALIWTGQGNYLTLVSDNETMARNSGVFWALLQSSFLFGNLFIFFQFRGLEIIGAETRTLVFSVLAIVGTLGVTSMLFLPNPTLLDSRNVIVEVSSSPIQELIKSYKLFCTKEMLLLSVTFFYTGLELSFFSGVYSACLSFTLRFSDPKKLVGLSGIFIGIGEIFGGALFGIFGKRTIKFGRDPIVMLGYVTHLVCFYLIFLNLPNSSPFGNTGDASFLTFGQPSATLAIFCSFLLGFGDSCFNTQIYSVLGSAYSDNSGPAFALFKFMQSLSAAACFFYASVLPLFWHLGILVLTATLGTVTFCMVEWIEFRKKFENRQDSQSVAVSAVSEGRSHEE